MEKRVNFKVIEFEGRKWKVKKFDALTGSFIAYTLMSQALPAGLEAVAGIPNLPKNRGAMTREEFMTLQKDCLKVCYEVLPAGETAVMNENGTFGVIGIEDDTKTVLFLTIQSLVFNVSSFFDVNLLTSLATAFKDLFPSDAKTLMNSSMDQ